MEIFPISGLVQEISTYPQAETEVEKENLNGIFSLRAVP